MPQVFVSYSHKDSEYAHRLADELRRHGIDAWIDERIDYGDQWLRVIQDNLNACRAFLLVMSANAFNSMWVQNEVSYAQANHKLIYPLLLDGPIWLAMAAMQHVDVRDRGMPPERFFNELRADLEQSAPPQGWERPPAAPVPQKTTPPRSKRAFFIAGAVLLFAAGACAVTLMAWRWLSSSVDQKPAVQAQVTAAPARPSVTPRPVSPAWEPSPTPEPALPPSGYSIAEKYGLPGTEREMPGMWIQAGWCYNLDILSSGEDPACDAFLDSEGLLSPVNGAQIRGYVPDRSLDLEVCRALIDELMGTSMPVSVPNEPIVCFLTNEGRLGFLFATEFALPEGIVFDAYVLP